MKNLNIWGIKKDKENRQENYRYIKNSINEDTVITAMLQQCTVEETNDYKKLPMYNSIVRSAVSYGAEKQTFRIKTHIDRN